MKEYLGDAVYIDQDEEYVILTTENGLLKPTNIIYLDSRVITALIKWLVENYPDTITGLTP